jgi:hypothetical protein
VTGLLRQRREHLARQRAESQALIDTSLAAGVPGLFLVEEEYRIALLAADEAFTGQLIARITDPGTDWTSPWAQFHGESAPSEEGD